MPVATIKQILSFRQAALSLGVSRFTVADIVRERGIATTRHPSNGRAIGLDLEAIKAIRRALKGR